MSYPQTPQPEPMKINAKLWSAIDSIGWSIKPYDREITCNTLDQSGYGSAFLPHTFSLSGSGLNRHWKYQLYSNTTKQYTTIFSKNSIYFNYTNNSLNFDDDNIGPDMCLQGRIMCEVVQSGVTKKYTLPIYLELRPVFVDCSVSNVNCPAGSNYYSMDVTLEGYGMRTGQITVCNEYAPSTEYHFHWPGIHTIHVDSVFKYGQSYLDVKLDNEYGSNVKMVYLDNPDATASTAMPVPSYQIQPRMNDETTDINSIKKERIDIRQYGKSIIIDMPEITDEVRITGLSGKEYFRDRNVCHLNTELPTGMYLLSITNRGNKQIYKINKK